MVQDSIQLLQAEGYKVTKSRLQVIEVLENAKQVVSPYEIQDLLRQQGSYLNHVTIYRVLNLLCHLNLAHRIPSSGKFARCNLRNRKGCHRFMICHRCGAMQEFVDEDLCRSENMIAQKTGFHTQYHVSESYGLCSNCYIKGRSTKDA
jgi:Fe2+ or Zn2+ uptake regulation protein